MAVDKHIRLTVVMYHYVRDLSRTRYPSIKALTVNEFVGQLGYLSQHYNFISGYDLLDVIESGESLPARPCLLTFDDGYLDHYTNVFPILDKMKISACFFPPAGCILESKILDVNKIHFLLASVADSAKLAGELLAQLDIYRTEWKLKTNEQYLAEYAVASRLDTAEIIFIKRMLQKVLPEELRNRITDHLFCKYVSSDERAFAAELYMSSEQIEHLLRSGMYIGSHGYNHMWLNALSADQQRKEVKLGLEFLAGIGADTERWIFCYPYGAYNDSLLDILAANGCRAGFTTAVDLADAYGKNPLILPRLDTIDLPTAAAAEPLEWTRLAAS